METKSKALDVKESNASVSIKLMSQYLYLINTGYKIYVWYYYHKHFVVRIDSSLWYRHPSSLLWFSCDIGWKMSQTLKYSVGSKIEQNCDKTSKSKWGYFNSLKYNNKEPNQAQIKLF